MKKPLLFRIILAVCIVIVAFVFAQFYPEGMISYWKFEEGSEATASDSVGENDGTIFGATWTTGQVDGALDFDGGDDYVKVDDDDSLSSSGGVTVEAWINADSFPGNYQMVVGKWNGEIREYEIQIWNEKARFWVYDGTKYYWAESSTTLLTSTWYHIAGVFDDINDELRVYINGAQDGVPIEFSGPIPNSSSYLTIGAQFWTSLWRLFDGVIDEVAIYNRALSAEEIQQHFQNGLNDSGYELECVPPPGGLVGWWPGDETTGATTEDIVDENDGILVGDATFASGKVGNALSFDGVGDYVSIGNMGLFPVQGTIDFWMKADAVQNFRNPFTTNYVGGNAGIRFEEHSSYVGYTNAFYAVVGNDAGGYGGHVFRYTASEPPYNNPMQANTWYHVALVWDTTVNNVKGYWDGVKVFDASHSDWPTELQDIAIGNGFSTDRYWDGLVDEVEIFNRALTASEIQAIYNAGGAGKCKVAPNQPPVASAEEVQMEECINLTGTLVSLDGSGSYDLDGDPLTYTWTGPFPEGGGTETGVSPTVTLPLGTSEVTLVVNDGQDDSEQVTVSITITVGVDGFLPPLASLVPDGEVVLLPRNAFKQGRTLPLKLQLFCGTTVLSDTDIAPPEIVGLVRDDNASDLETMDMDAGEANDNGPLFRFADPIWVYNLSTRDLESGTYVITIEMPDGRLFKGTFMLR